MRKNCIESCVVNAVNIPQTNNGILSKTDAADARRIGEAFSKGLVKFIYTPKANIEADRNLVRYKKRTEETN